MVCLLLSLSIFGICLAAKSRKVRATFGNASTKKKVLKFMLSGVEMVIILILSYKFMNVLCCFFLLMFLLKLCLRLCKRSCRVKFLSFRRWSFSRTSLVWSLLLCMVIWMVVLF